MGPLYCALISQIAIILAFAIIGAGLKYIDDAFDEDRFSKKKAISIAPIIVLIWICLSLFDSVSATILFSILFAVLLTGKIDNLIFKVSTIALISILFLTQMLNLLWIPLVFLTLMGVADEKGNDYVDNHATLKLVEFLFSYRFCMKMGLLSLCILTLLPWLYLLAFLAHDGAYESVRMLGKISVAHQRKKKHTIAISPTVNE
uniref:Uncharacterized protein n=1 Tax=Candidatus Methanophaga sp. ANME-1 ERB7 TaxID=2759913 RepID=A0A7G9Z9Q1_9EURY|nr:conserved hypothetical protein [uncultured archaeon GZfos1D1]QNO56985.1 hypothetical protein MGAOFDBH_00002 [Methanosarcinales archaeon ANME-1 ERB7]